MLGMTHLPNVGFLIGSLNWQGGQDEDGQHYNRYRQGQKREEHCNDDLT